jgi:hypothetical protein
VRLATAATVMDHASHRSQRLVAWSATSNGGTAQLLLAKIVVNGSVVPAPESTLVATPEPRSIILLGQALWHSRSTDAGGARHKVGLPFQARRPGTGGKSFQSTSSSSWIGWRHHGVLGAHRGSAARARDEKSVHQLTSRPRPTTAFLPVSVVIG